MLVIIDKTSLGERFLGTIAHDRSVRTRAADKLESGEQRRLAGARLARKHSETRCKGNRRILNEGDVGYVELVKHAPSLLPLGHVWMRTTEKDARDVPEKGVTTTCQKQVTLPTAHLDRRGLLDVDHDPVHEHRSIT